MSDVSQGPGWWQASDGKWYASAAADRPGPGWWLASDGNWYAPESAPTDASDPTVRTPVKPVAKRAAAVEPVARTSSPLPTSATPIVERTTPVAAKPSTSAERATPVSVEAPGGPVAAPAGPSSTAPAAEMSHQPVATPAGPATSGSIARGAGPRLDTPPGPAVVPARSSPSAGEQIRARDDQSRRDAQVLLDARRSAASRALGNLRAHIDLDEPKPARHLGASDVAVPPSSAEPPPPVPRSSASAPEATTTGKVGRVPATAPAPTRPSEPPLLEVKQGTLAADIEHIGERLVIFNDRVELHDRNDRVRQVIAGGDIADVVVHKKFTGSTVTVESGTGERIVAKGLKPEQADEIRSVILKRSRSGGSLGSSTEPAVGPARTAGSPGGPDDSVVDARTSPAGSAIGPDDRRGLIASLEHLHRSGVLSDAELTEKKALVERLVNGDTLAATSPSH